MEELVEGVEINGILLHACRGKISLWVDGEIGVVALVGEERRNACGSAWSIIVRELCERQEFGPIVLLIVGINPQVLLKRLVHLLSLSVPFRMLARGEVEVDVKGFTQRAEKVGDELQSPVRGDVGRNSVFREHMEKEQLC
jgi:hypothetical protein